VSLVSGTSAPALTVSLSSVPILIQGYVTFTSTTAATAMLEAYVQNGTSASTAGAVQTWLNVANATGLTTTASKVLTVDWTWTTAETTNSISIYTSSFERIS
jgi:hypothetical protein